MVVADLSKHPTSPLTFDPLPTPTPTATPTNTPTATPTNTPTLTWNSVTWATGYQVQVDDNADFSSPAFETTVDAATLDVTTSPLGNGFYHWRARAQRPDGSWGGWSVVDTFTVDSD